MSSSNLLLRRAIASALALSCTMAAAASWAEGPPSPSITTLDEIIVTAQKREQNIQDVPIVVTAVTEQLLKDTGVKDIKSLTILTPGLTVTSTGSEASTTARIRGIGTVGDNPGLESSVGVVIDGVYRPRNGVGFGDLGELERIEVLKGPQGTLFGKNNDAGVINILTKNPTQTFGVDASVTAGNYRDKEGTASINGPLGDMVSGRLFVGAVSRDGTLNIGDGIGPNTQDATNSRKYTTARGQLLITPADKVDIRLIADFTNRNESCCGAVQIISSPAVGILQALGGGKAVVAGNPPNVVSRDAFANQPINQQIRDEGFSAELNWDMDVAKLTSVTAWRDWQFTGAQDIDYTGADIIYSANNGKNHTEFKQLSEELRLSGEAGRVNWLVGAFYAHENLDATDDVRVGSEWETYLSLVASGGADPTFLHDVTGNAVGATFPANSGYNDSFSQVSKSYAVFTNDTIKIADGLDFLVGLRYTTEKKEADIAYNNSNNGFGCNSLINAIEGGGVPAGSIPALVGIGCFDGFSPTFNGVSFSQSNIDEHNVSGTAKFVYRFNDEVMTYLSYARGYKAGGYNLDRVPTSAIAPAGTPANLVAASALGILPGGGFPNTNTSFGAETVNSYELGLKTTLADKTLLLNVAVFDQKYQDFQLNTFTGIEFVVSSLPAVESKGVDLDTLWFTPLKGLSFQGGVTYANTEITDFGGAANLALFDAGRVSNRISFAPLWSGTMSGTYEVPLSAGLTLRSNVGFKYTSSYNTGSDLNPAKIQGAFGLLNARLGLGAPDGKWAVEAWATNLANKAYYQVAFDAPFQHFVPQSGLDAFIGDPRIFGLTVRVKI